MEKIKKIGKKQFDFNDGVYAMWYFCPYCKGDYILRRFNFCPHCGKKLHWTKEIQKHRIAFGLEP